MKPPLPMIIAFLALAALVLPTPCTSQTTELLTSANSTLAQTRQRPMPAGHLVASAASEVQINLSWSDRSDNEDGFKIERSTDGGKFTQIAQVTANITSFGDTGLFPDTRYSYRVRAYNASGDAGYSNPDNARTPSPACSWFVAEWGYPYGPTPTGLTGVVAIAEGGGHSLALRQDGTVIGWGDNSIGQATPPTNLIGVVAIAAGGYHSLALKRDGTVVGWGDYYGQAVPSSNLIGVAQIAAGGY